MAINLYKKREYIAQQPYFLQSHLSGFATMMELTKIRYKEQIELHRWLRSLVSEEFYSTLEPSLFKIIDEFCRLSRSSLVVFNDQFKQAVLPLISLTLNNYLEKVALQKIIESTQLPLQPLKLIGLTSHQQFYQALANHEYAMVNLPVTSHLPQTVQVRRLLTHNQQIRLDLIKRILNLWRATEIALGPMFNSKIRDYFLAHIAEIQKLTAEKLTTFRILQKIIKKYLQSLAWTMAEIVSRKLSVEPPIAQKLLNQTEGLVNWERSRMCTVTVSAQSFEGKALYHLQIDAPFKMLLTPEQKKEYERITEKNLADQPKWFSRLHPVEKLWLIRNQKKIINGELNCPSSLTRHLPGVTNFNKFTDIIADDTYQIVSVHSSIRRHTLSLTVKDTDENQRLTQLNGDQLFACAKPKETFDNYWGELFNQLSTPKPSILFLDLGALTPLNAGAASVVDLVPYQENNTYMQSANEAAIEHIKDTVNKDVTVLGTNIAVNTEREYSDNFNEYSFQQVTAKLKTYVSLLCFALSQRKLDEMLKNDLECLYRLLINPQTNMNDLIGIIDKLKKQKHEIANTFFAGDIKKAARFILAFEALHDYLVITTQHARINDTNNRGLFAAALLQILVSHLGGTVTGGCKSAKDRWGAVLMQTSAMLSYYHKYQELPKVTDQGDTRKKFVHEFTTVFTSGHQQHMASVNVYGANGTLDGTNPPTRVLQKIGVEFIPMFPVDIQQQVGRERLDTHQIFAESSKWKFRDPVSPWKLFLNDLSTIFHTLTCGIFRKRRPSASDNQQDDFVKSKNSLAKLAKLGGPIHANSMPNLSSVSIQNVQRQLQSAPNLSLIHPTSSSNVSVLQDIAIDLRP